MNSERIKTLAKCINKEDIVIDVGCDHGYLSIYLKENNMCKEIYASDISENALNNARQNFKKNNLDIKTFVSDGFENISVQFDTAVIAGMGTTTILDILNNEKCPKKLVIGSHNDLYKLRKELNKLGFKLTNETIVLENGHYYVILLYIKGKQKLKRRELKFGISNNNEYYEHLIKKNQKIIKVVPLRKKIILSYEIFILKRLTKRK